MIAKVTQEITNTEDIIDSRDVIDRIDYLEDEIASVEHDDGIPEADDTAELATLRALVTECEGFDDWTYGVALIRDTYFQTYAEELADDIGAIDASASWPTAYIDWERAAEALQMDYGSVEFDGVTYWLR